MDFTGTVSTSGTSYVIAIPKVVVKDKKLKKGTKVTITYENDQLIIPLDWVDLINQCERIFENQINKFTYFILEPNIPLHPFVYEILHSILSLIKHVYLKNYGLDHLKIKMIETMIKSLKKDPASRYQYETYEDKVVDSVDESKIIGERGDFSKDAKDNSPYQEYLKVKELKKILPDKYKTHFEESITICGFIQGSSTNGSKHANNKYIKEILDEIESDKFNKFLNSLIQLEQIHHIEQPRL